MTREQREQFVRDQIFQINTWEEAVQRIVDCWEDDLIETYDKGRIDTRDVENY